MLYDPNNVNDYWHPWNQYGYHGQMRRQQEQQRRQAEIPFPDPVTSLVCVYALICFGISHLVAPVVGCLMFSLGLEGAAGVWIYRAWKNRRS